MKFCGIPSSLALGVGALSGRGAGDASALSPGPSALILVRARNRGDYVRPTRNALRAYYVPIACTYWARNALRAQYVPSTCPVRARNVHVKSSF